MAQTLLVTSGKGGTGKTTVAQLLGRALALRGKNVLLVELDSGLRGLDLMLGVSDKVVYDLSDVLCSRCKPIKAITTVETTAGNLHLIPAPVNRCFVPETIALQKLLDGLAGCYDFLILDSAAGFGVGFDLVASLCRTALLVTNCDPISIRDAASVASALPNCELRLVINRFTQKQLIPALPNLDSVIDLVGARLISVVPWDEAVASSCANGIPTPECPAFWEIIDLAARLLGEDKPLNQKRLK